MPDRLRKPAKEVTTNSDAAMPTSASAGAVHQDTIQLGPFRGRNAMAIWLDLVDTRGFTGGYQRVKRVVGKLVGSRTAPGERAGVGYGTGPMVRDPRSGKYRRMHLFVLTLSYRRKAERLLVFQSSTQNRAELHEMPSGDWAAARVCGAG